MTRRSLLWDVAFDQVISLAVPVCRNWTAVELEKLVADLGGDDASKAFDAICALATAPDKALPLLEKILARARPMDAKQVQAWIGQLESASYIVREKASKELEKLGDAVEKPLLDALVAGMALEKRRRIEMLLDKINRLPVPSNELRDLRALEVLEKIGAPQAQRILETLAGGSNT